MVEGVMDTLLLEWPASGDSGTCKLFKYISCIKVNGRPVLPPLLTTEKRKEMKTYRDKAVEVEKRIASRSRDSFSSDGIHAVENKSTPARPATLNLSRRSDGQSPGFHDTLEHRLALESESETESERKRWSPLKVDSLNDLRLQVAGDSDSAQDTPDTVTASPRPRLLRQGTHTLLKTETALQNTFRSDHGSQNLDTTCSTLPEFFSSQPNLLTSSHSLGAPGTDLRDFFESQQRQQLRSNSGRRTWDLRQARENWTSTRGLGSESDESRPITPSTSRNDGSESRGKARLRPASVPSSDRVPSECPEPRVNVPSTVREQLGSLSDMMIALTLRHEQQRRELELQQSAEREQYEQLFTFKQRQILQFISTSMRDPQSLPTSFCAGTNFDDVSFISEPVRQAPVARPQSARDLRSLAHRRAQQNGKPKDEEGGALDTDIDVSMVEDPCPVKDVDDDCETWTLSSRSSTISNEPTAAVVLPLQRHATFRGCSATELARYTKAASVINAAVRGFLTRRLMRTEQVRALRRSLMDSIHVCRTLKAASDLGSSDVKFMASLKRQIFSDWDALYDIFLLKTKPEQLEMISLDRERLKSQKKTAQDSGGRRMSAATVKSLQRKQKGMSTSLTVPPRSPSFKRSCFKMSASLSGALPSGRSTCK